MPQLDHEIYTYVLHNQEEEEEEAEEGGGEEEAWGHGRQNVIMQTNADVHANSCDVVFSAASSLEQTQWN